MPLPLVKFGSWISFLPSDRYVSDISYAVSVLSSCRCDRLSAEDVAVKLGHSSGASADLDSYCRYLSSLELAAFDTQLRGEVQR